MNFIIHKQSILPKRTSGIQFQQWKIRDPLAFDQTTDIHSYSRPPGAGPPLEHRIFAPDPKVHLINSSIWVLMCIFLVIMF